jgi:hypothetical protein
MAEAKRKPLILEISKFCTSQKIGHPLKSQD